MWGISLRTVMCENGNLVMGQLQILGFTGMIPGNFCADTF
jgi:hypothetical protein